MHTFQHSNFNTIDTNFKMVTGRDFLSVLNRRNMKIFTYKLLHISQFACHSAQFRVCCAKNLMQKFDMMYVYLVFILSHEEEEEEEEEANGV